jgi:hypothetical protein
MEPAKIYLGDAVYAEFDGSGIILTVEYGHGPAPAQEIILEPYVIEKLIAFSKLHNVIK